MRDIGKNIRDLRIQRNMTQDELAEKLFVTRQTVSNYETGKSRPDIEMLERIAEVLDADIRQVLYGTATLVEKRKLQWLIIGASLVLLTSILFISLEPMASYIRSRYYLSGLHLFRGFFLLGLCFLFLGWTLAHLLGMALKKEPLSAIWTIYVRRGLLLLTIFVIIFLLAYFVPYLTAEYRFYHATGERAFSDYYQASAWMNALFGKLLFLYVDAFPYVLAVPLCIGGLLWLFGFPKVRPSDKNI